MLDLLEEIVTQTQNAAVFELHLDTCEPSLNQYTSPSAVGFVKCQHPAVDWQPRRPKFQDPCSPLGAGAQPPRLIHGTDARSKR